MHLIYNGEYLAEKDFQVGLQNRAFTYGDGVFETIVATFEKVHFLSDHFERLSAGIKTLGMIVPEKLSLNFIDASIKSLISKNNLSKARIKIIVWRKSGGFFSPQSNEAEFIIIASPYIQPPTHSEKVYIYDKVRITFSPFSRFKTLSSLPYVMAGIAKNDLKADDLVLLDTEGNIAEGLISNLFWIRENVIFTPSIETGCKEGIMRKQILSFLNKSNIQWVEGKFKKEELLSADFAFTSNVTGLVPILQIEDKVYDTSSDLFKKFTTILNIHSQSQD